MLTAIQFIGLIVTTLMNPTSSGAQLIIGKFNFPPPQQHERLIAYLQGTRDATSTWPQNGPTFKGCDGNMYDSVRLNFENITISGPTDPFNYQVGTMPHLSCCCDTYNAFNPSWGKSSTSNGRNSAFVNVANGTYTSWVMKTGAIATVLFPGATSKISFTASTPGNPAQMKLIINTPSSIIVANETMAGLTCQPQTTPHNPDFWKYYDMRLNTSNTCNGVPKTPPCAPKLTFCQTTQPFPPGTNTQGGSANPDLTPEQKKWIADHGGKSNTVDVNCSSSQWP